jgi:hypothetical protein
MNGDGLDDAVVMSDGLMYALFSTGSAFSYRGVSYPPGQFAAHFLNWTQNNKDDLAWFLGGDMHITTVGSSLAFTTSVASSVLPFTSLSVGNQKRLLDGAYDFGDMDSDLYDDAVIFGEDGVLVSKQINHLFDGFQTFTQAFSSKNGWDFRQYPLMLGDVTGDGIPELVGFGEDGVYVRQQ